MGSPAAISAFIRLLEAVRQLEANGNDQRAIRSMLEFILTNGRLVADVDAREIEAELRESLLH
jgi:hypothetical protein